MQENISEDFQQNTKLNVGGHSLCLKRSGITAVVIENVLDNRFVVTCNRFLLLKHDAHINVEV